MYAVFRSDRRVLILCDEDAVSAIATAEMMIAQSGHGVHNETRWTQRRVRRASQ